MNQNASQIFQRAKKSSGPPASSIAAFNRMKSQAQRDTRPELQLRALLHKNGLRFRVHCKPMAKFNTRADIVFKKARVAVFVDGCFWHGCPWHGTRAKQNQAWWRSKIENNRRRDRKTTQRLKRAGWKVIRVWEHGYPEKRVQKIMTCIQERTSIKG